MVPRLNTDTILAVILVIRRGFTSGTPGILTQAEFVAAVRRERARSDRADRPFAVLLVGLGAVPSERIEMVPRLLKEIVRETDEVGWFDGVRLGILLPECSGEQAEIVAGKIRDGLGMPDSNGTVRVYLHGDQCVKADAKPVAACTNGIRAGDRMSTCSAVFTTPGEASLEVGQDAEDIDHLAEILVSPLPAWKRAMDIVGASTLLLMLSPVLLGVAVAVRRSSPGPIIFRQQRAGLGGRPFTFYKFRTMNRDAEAQQAGLMDRNEASGPVFKIDDDPRITPIGKVLRRTSLDELPQLFNVLVGDMTLVGPRPPTLNEVSQYRTWQGHRLDVTGGITCTWQVSGRCTIPFEEWMRMDSRYIQKRSPVKDIDLLLRTVGAVMSGKGAK